MRHRYRSCASCPRILLAAAVAAAATGRAQASFEPVARSTAHGDAAAHTAAGGPYYVLKPSDYRSVLGADYDWATANIPLFESANRTLDLVYFFRWRTFHSHIHPTDDSDIPWVVTEFAPNVKWAGKYNTSYPGLRFYTMS